MSVRATKATSGVSAPSELHIMLTDAAPLESAGAAVRACALSKGFMAERPTDVIPEAGKMIVDPRYRGHHLAERLSLKREETATERAIPGMWSETVINHPASQRLAIERGAAEVGLLIGISPMWSAAVLEPALPLRSRGEGLHDDDVAAGR